LNVSEKTIIGILQGRVRRFQNIIIPNGRENGRDGRFTNFTTQPNPWGVEVISEKLAKLPLKELSTKAFNTTLAEFAD
jgi:hypothetical protein